MSIDHAAALLEVSRRTIYNRIRDGRLQTVRTIGGSQRVLMESIEQLRGQMPPSKSERRARLLTALLALSICLIAWLPAEAAHRARLSADLSDHLSAGSPSIDVIVHGTKAEIDAIASRHNVRIRRYLTSGAVLRLTAGQLSALRDDDAVDHLSGDTRIRSTTDVTAESIGADQVWAGAGELRPLSGAGIGVAVIDSGIDTRHTALRRRVVASVDFTGGDGSDLYGHGTHVASVIAGEPGRTAGTTDYRGIAFGASLINLRVLDETGSGYASDVVEAIDWAIEHQRQFNIRIINLSLGAPVLQPFRDDPLCEAVERAVRAGLVVVAAAGNFGKTDDGKVVFGGITSPANSPYAIAVGAIDTHGTPERSDDTVASYSSRGPTRYDLVIKPDLSAPGSHIVGAEAAGSYLSRTYPARHVTGSGNDAYIQLSGTSQAAAVTSGAVALVLEEDPQLSAPETRGVLQLSSSAVEPFGMLDIGAGSLNVLSATMFVNAGLSGALRATRIAEELIWPAGVLTTYLATSQQILSTRNVVWSGSKTRGTVTLWFGSLRVGRAAKQIGVAWPGSDSRSEQRGSRLLRHHASALVNPHSLLSDDSIVWSGSLIGDDSIVWSGSLFGDDSIVWSGSIFGDDSIVWSGSLFGDDSIVWSGSMFGDDSIVWSGSLFGDDSIVWSGSVFGDDSIVWSGSLLWDDSIVWSGSVND